MNMKKTPDWLRVKILRWVSRCAVGGPHTLRRPSRDPMVRVIGTIGRGGAAAVRCQEDNVLHLAFALQQYGHLPIAGTLSRC